MEIGTIAAILTTISFLPQVIKVVQTKDTSAISLPMYIMFVAGIFCWVIYGFMLNDMNILIANLITLILSSTILIFKIIDVKK
ncbi:MAG: SemiSWEET transporter [Mycoplasmatales bacterium]